MRNVKILLLEKKMRKYYEMYKKVKKINTYSKGKDVKIFQKAKFSRNLSKNIIEKVVNMRHILCTEACILK